MENRKPHNAARDGMTVRELADLLEAYARRNPDAIVKFSSGESGGFWPRGFYSKTPMGLFTGEQIAIHDGTACGEGVHMGLMLQAFAPLNRAE